MPIAQDISTKLSVPAPDKMIFAYTEEHPSIQDAIDYAETLPASDDPLDVTGVGVFVPAGLYDENVTIRKNISLFGQGRKATSITSVTYRPSAACEDPFAIVGAPVSCSITDMSVGNIVVDKETAPASGLFNYFLATSAYVFSNCFIGGYVSAYAQQIFFYGCELGGTAGGLGGPDIFTSTNDQLITFTNSEIHSNFTFYSDDTTFPTAYTDVALIQANLFCTNTAFNSGSILTVDMAPGSGLFVGGSYLFARNCYISNLVQGAGTGFNIAGGFIDSRTITAPIYGSTFNVFAPPCMTSRATPQLISSATFTPVAGSDQLLHIAGDSAPQTITAIDPGARAGNKLKFICVDSVNTVEFQPGASIVMPKGAITLVDGDYIEFIWDGDTLWIECTRNR